MEDGHPDDNGGSAPTAAGNPDATATAAPGAAGESANRHQGATLERQIAQISADNAEIKGILKLLHQGHKELAGKFDTHIHQPVEVVHATENAPQATEAAAETKADAAAAPAVPPSQPEAPASPPVRPQRAGLFNKRGR